MRTIIEANNLVKTFGDTVALKDVSFNVGEGEIFGLIGPDGAGKTTLFRILTTLLLPDSGRATVMGFDVIRDFRVIRKNIGYMPGRFSLYQDLSVEENLNFYATVFGTTIKENYDLIADIYSHIEPYKKRLAGRLSGGMKQKLALSCALIHKPALLVLDEPTTGVDAVSRAEFWEMLARLKQHNITIIVSTPYMDEAMRCNRVALIQKGEIMIIDTPENIRSGFNGRLFSVSSDKKYDLIKALRQTAGVTSVFPFGETVHITMKEGVKENDVIKHLFENNFSDIVIHKAEPTIEDRFLELMEKRD